MVKFKYALQAYDVAYGRFLALQNEYQAFGERPKRLLVFASDFLEMAERDNQAVARGEQRAPRYKRALP